MSIRALLQPQSVLLNVQAADSSDVIRQMGNTLLEAGFVREDFIDATLKREETHPTGLPLAGEYNAALPHVDIDYVKQSALALATLQAPVVFQNMVDPAQAVPVRLVIMLALAEAKSQIEMLSQVAAILQQPPIVAELVHAASTEEMFAVLRRVEST